MAETLTGSVTVTVDLTHKNVLDLTSVTDAIKKTYSTTFTSGTGANAAENVFHDQRTVTSSATDSLDLSGVLTNAYGTSLTFTKIKGLIVSAASGNTNDVHIQCPASNGFVNWCLAASDGVVVKPGGVFALVNPSSGGYAVTASTGDLLSIINSAGTTSVIYDIIIFGETT